MTSDKMTPEQELEAEAWEEATRLTRLVEGGTDDPKQAAKMAMDAGRAWMRASWATRQVVLKGLE